MNLEIDDTKTMTHIWYKLPDEYDTIVENLGDKLDGKYNTLYFEIICGKISEKYNLTSLLLETNNSK